MYSVAKADNRFCESCGVVQITEVATCLDLANLGITNRTSVLEKCGVPPTMLSIIHDGMQAEVRVGDTTTDRIEVRNGLQQGCTLAPSLFNIYFSTIAGYWRARCPEAGVTVRYRHGRKLVGDRTAKSRLDLVRVTESQFAAVYATSRDTFESAIGGFVDAASKWGLTVGIAKSSAATVHLLTSCQCSLKEGR